MRPHPLEGWLPSCVILTFAFLSLDYSSFLYVNQSALGFLCTVSLMEGTVVFYSTRRVRVACRWVSETPSSGPD